MTPGIDELQALAMKLITRTQTLWNHKFDLKHPQNLTHTHQRIANSRQKTDN